MADSELEAVNIAMNVEMKSHNRYQCLSEESTYAMEKRFYEGLTGEEQEHHLTLSDACEYLSDPAGWFTKTEH